MLTTSFVTRTSLVKRHLFSASHSLHVNSKSFSSSNTLMANGRHDKVVIIGSGPAGM